MNLRTPPKSAGKKGSPQHTPRSAEGSEPPRTPGTGDQPPPTQQTPPSTPTGRGPLARQVMNSRKGPFTRGQPRSASTAPQRFSLPVGGVIGQAKAQAPHKQLFGGDPPRVVRETLPEGGLRYSFTQPLSVAELQPAIAAVCQEWFATAATLPDALALLDAVCAQLDAPDLWARLLSRHGAQLPGLRAPGDTALAFAGILQAVRALAGQRWCAPDSPCHVEPASREALRQLLARVDPTAANALALDEIAQALTQHPGPASVPPQQAHAWMKQLHGLAQDALARQDLALAQGAALLARQITERLSADGPASSRAAAQALCKVLNSAVLAAVQRLLNQGLAPLFELELSLAEPPEGIQVQGLRLQPGPIGSQAREALHAWVLRQIARGADAVCLGWPALLQLLRLAQRELGAPEPADWLRFALAMAVQRQNAEPLKDVLKRLPGGEPLAQEALLAVLACCGDPALTRSDRGELLQLTEALLPDPSDAPALHSEYQRALRLLQAPMTPLTPLTPFTSAHKPTPAARSHTQVRATRLGATRRAPPLQLDAPPEPALAALSLGEWLRLELHTPPGALEQELLSIRIDTQNPALLTPLGRERARTLLLDFIEAQLNEPQGLSWLALGELVGALVQPLRLAADPLQAPQRWLQEARRGDLEPLIDGLQQWSGVSDTAYRSLLEVVQTVRYSVLMDEAACHGMLQALFPWIAHYPQGDALRWSCERAIREKLSPALADDMLFELDRLPDAADIDAAWLQGVLDIALAPSQDPETRTELLRLAYPWLARTQDASQQLRRDYGDAIHRWLAADEVRLLQAANTGVRPADALSCEQQLLALGWSAEAAQAVLAQGGAAYEGLHQRFFSGPCAALLQAEGAGFDGLLNDAQVRDLMRVCSAWWPVQPASALQLLDSAMKARIPDPLQRQELVTHFTAKRQPPAQVSAQMSAQVPESAQARSAQARQALASWLGIRLQTEASGRITGASAHPNTDSSALSNAKGLAQARDRLWRWIALELEDPLGIPWDALMAVLQTVKTRWPGLNWGTEDAELKLRMCVREAKRSGGIEPLLDLLPNLAGQALGTDTLQDMFGLLSSLGSVTPADRAMLIQLGFSLLPEREGHEAVHNACLACIAAQSDPELCALLLRGYLKSRPFAPDSEAARLAALVVALGEPPVADAVAAWNSLATAPIPPASTPWPQWRALCTVAGRLLASATLSGMRADRKLVLSTTLLHALQQLAKLPDASHASSNAQAIERQFELLAIWTQDLPVAQRLPWLNQLSTTCTLQLQELLRDAPGRPQTPLPVRLIALQAGLQVLIEEHSGATGAPRPTSQHAKADRGLRFFADWLRAGQAERLGTLQPGEPDRQMVRLLHQTEAWHQPLDPALSQTIAALFQLHARQ